MVEGRCRYSLQWRVSGRFKEQDELNNAQYIEWEKILVDYCGLFGLLRQHFIKQCFKTEVSVDVLRFLMWTGLKKSFKTKKTMHIHSIVFVRYSSIGFEVTRLSCIP